jgi:hypothetical protein
MTTAGVGEAVGLMNLACELSDVPSDSCHRELILCRAHVHADSDVWIGWAPWCRNTLRWCRQRAALLTITWCLSLNSTKQIFASSLPGAPTVGIYDNEFVWGWSRDRENDGNTGDARIFRQVRTSRRIITLRPMFLYYSGKWCCGCRWRFFLGRRQGLQEKSSDRLQL